MYTCTKIYADKYVHVIQAIILLACYNKLFSWWERLSQISATYVFFCKPLLWLSSSNFLKKNFIIFFISWRLITLQYCSRFCHTLKWISHGFTCVPHPDPLSHLLLRPIPLVLPSAAGPSTRLMHPTWAGDLFHPR